MFDCSEQDSIDTDIDLVLYHLTIDKDQIYFTNDGSTSATFKLENTGWIDIIIQSILIDTDSFTISSAIPTVIKPKHSSEVTILYDPIKWGTRIGKVTINAGRAGSYSIELVGPGSKNGFSLLNGSLLDPDSFNSSGGKTGSLGFYPIAFPNGTIGYLPSIARLYSTFELVSAEW